MKMISNEISNSNLEPKIYNKKYLELDFIANGFFGYVYRIKDIQTDKMYLYISNKNY
jgi:hypothetical protein